MQATSEQDDEFKKCNQSKNLSLESFDVGKKLARGKIGNVYMARTRKEHFIVALKVLNKSEIVTQNMQQQLKREIEIQAKLEHPHILMLYNYFHDKDRVYLVLEYAPKGELFKVLQKLGKFGDGMTSRIIKQVIDALEYCHCHDVIHRDIKPENILLGIKGTLDYLAPEIVCGQSYDFHVDLWCLGVLAFELLTGKPPFASTSTSQTRRLIKSCQYEIPKFVSPYANKFIKDLLALNPSDRMPLEQAKTHLWIVLYQLSKE